MGKPGQFQRGNATATAGGHARAAALTPDERRAIAQKGLQTIADRLFDGDVVAAQLWLSERGAIARRAAAAARRAAREAARRAEK